MEDLLQVPGVEGFEKLLNEAVMVESGHLVVSNDNGELQCYENVKLHLPGDASNVLRAWFGLPSDPWLDAEHKGVPCTQAVQRLLHGRRAVITSPGALGCDPCPGVWKQFRVQLRDPDGFRAEEPQSLRYWKTLEEVPSAAEGRWVAFVRHAQAGHNVDKALIMNPDNALTDEGLKQAARGREDLAGTTLRQAQLIVTSPLTRAMQTTSLLMGPDCTVPVQVDPSISERWSAPCDEGTPKSQLLLQDLPGLEQMKFWQGWDVLEELWWPTSGEDSWARAEDFVAKVRDGMPMERIVFVGHGGFWDMVLGKHLNNCEVVFCDRSLR